jgi:hypothetical protein
MTPLKSNVIVIANASEHCNLFTAKTRDSSVAAKGLQAGVFWCETRTARY